MMKINFIPAPPSSFCAFAPIYVCVCVYYTSRSKLSIGTKHFTSQSRATLRNNRVKAKNRDTNVRDILRKNCHFERKFQSLIRDRYKGDINLSCA